MKRKVVIAAITTLAVCSATALAYFLIVYTFTGESSPTAVGKSTPVSETLTVSFPAGVVPGSKVPITVKTNPASSVPLNPGAKLTFTVKTSVEACNPAWFTVTTTATEGPLFKMMNGGTSEVAIIPAGLHTLGEKGDPTLEAQEHPIYLNMQEESVVNQSACESSTVAVKAILTGSVN